MNFIFPPHCPECDAYVETSGGWCEACLLKRLGVHRLPVDADMTKALDGAWALGSYDGALKRLIKRLKFQKDRGTLPAIHSFLQAAQRNLPAELRGVSLMTVVPLHETKEKERGFNQAELIFAPFTAGEINLPYEKLLLRTRATRPQFELRAEERRDNLKGAFDFRGNADISGRTILVTDDIMTTGATLFECAQVLKKHGASRVYALVLASDR